jgi:AraC-like DNA-binding protein
MAFVPPARHLLRAKDLADARYFEPLGVSDLAGATGLSLAHFSREFRRAFVEEPEERPYGIDSAFRDPSGNHIRLTQVREMAAL